MATQILAVDDSVTMRKILEITFAGTEFNVVAVGSGDAALAKLKSDAFGLVISDITLEPTNGYELCKQMKAAAPSTPVLLLSSRQNPYDANAGSASGADDHIDKPFDTQQMIDRVQKMLREGVTAAPAQPAAQVTAASAAAAGQGRAKTLIYGGPGSPGAPAPAPAPAPAAERPGGSTLPSAAPAAAKPAGGSAGMRFPQQSAPAASRAPAPAAQPAPQPAARPAAQPAPAAAPVAAAAAPAVANAVNGQLAAKVADLGLTPAQVDAVLALSRELVERVVWEVVPVLAETIIKEEIARLTK